MGDQYPVEIQQRRRKLVPLLKQTKSEGKHAILVYDKLYINGSRYVEQSQDSNMVGHQRGSERHFFIDAKEFMVPYLVKIYNKIYGSGVYPESWCKALIVLIHKRGDRNDPNNYGGIMLISVSAKLFSLVLRNRMNTWCEDNEVSIWISGWQEHVRRYLYIACIGSARIKG